jgi:hypothetical protein
MHASLHAARRSTRCGRGEVGASGRGRGAIHRARNRTLKACVPLMPAEAGLKPTAEAGAQFARIFILHYHLRWSGRLTQRESATFTR